MPLTREVLRERFDRRASALGKTFQLIGLQETVGIYRDELNDHAAPPGIVERLRELFVSRLEKPVQRQITLMETPRAVGEDWLRVVERAFTEPLERQLSDLAKNLPI